MDEKFWTLTVHPANYNVNPDIKPISLKGFLTRDDAVKYYDPVLLSRARSG